MESLNVFTRHQLAAIYRVFVLALCFAVYCCSGQILAAPFTASIEAVPPVPVVSPSAVCTVGDLRLVFSGGTAGQNTTVSVALYLNVSLAAASATDTAQLTGPSGLKIPGARTSMAASARSPACISTRPASGCR